MPSDLGTTNLWLAIIAVANVISLLALAGAAIVVIRLTKRASAVVDKVEQKAAPVIARANGLVMDAQRVVDDAKAMVAKVKRANDAVRHAVSTAEHVAARAATTARSQLWPVVGLMRGVSAMAATLTRSANGHSRVPDEEIAKERFANEGGGSHARERNL